MVTEARAASVNGRAMLSNGNGQPPFALTRGFALNPGDRVDTRGGGQVVIDLSDGSMVVVQPESVVVLKDFRAAGSLRELFEITLGRVRVKINHFGGRPNPYRMNSPTASIAVRGTEFSVIVDAQGDTQVVVYEGAVEVASLSDPNRRVLIEAGRGVVVRPGQDFHLFAPLAGGREMGDRGGESGDADHDRHAMAQAGAQQPQHQDNRASSPPAGPGQPGQDSHSQPHGDGDANSPRATAGTYERYIAGLAEIGQTPFLLRFNAFPESHLDSLENPAYATDFRSGEARLFFLPSFSGTQPYPQASGFASSGTQPSVYSLSPQFSAFTPLAGSRFVVGGSVSSSRVGSGAQGNSADPDDANFGHAVNPTLLNLTGSSTSNYWSGSLVAARRFGPSGNNSFGLEIEKLIGNGTLSNTSVDADPTGQQSIDTLLTRSNISQTRVTAGLSHEFAGNHKLGVFYRYGLVSASDNDTSHIFNGIGLPLNSTSSGGHSAELGMRLRGPLTERLFYGLDASLVGLSLDDGLVRPGVAISHQRDRARRGALGLGLGYLLSPRVILSFDAVGGSSSLDALRFANTTGALLQTGQGDDRFVSVHGAIQANLSRHLFVSGSLLSVWRARNLGFAVFPDASGSGSLVSDSFFPIPPLPFQPVGRYSDFGAGWRFSPDFFMQYVYSTDYGYTQSSHMLMLRYTIHFHRE